MDAAITVDGVSKRYRLYQERNQSLKASFLRGRRAVFRELWALKDVSLEISKGSTFGLIGHNGSGKSTLLKCIARILRPEIGTITTDGKISALLELGAGFHPELSGRDNVYLNGSILGLSKRDIEARFDDIVEFSGLADRIDTPVKNYSSGMYIRLGFSVAINVDPEILLIDEILTVGDEQFQRKCAEKFDDLRGQGKTIVIVSHGLGSINDLCDEVALLDHGELKAVGKPADVIDTYLGGVESNVRPDGMHGMRYGAGGAAIEYVELLDAQGQPCREYKTGDAVCFRIHYSCERPIERPVFRIEVHDHHGHVIAGSNTKTWGRVPASVSGYGAVDYLVGRLMLTAGNYELSATLFDFGCADPYDVRHRFMSFAVEPYGFPPDFDGIFSLDGRWSGQALDGGDND